MTTVQLTLKSGNEKTGPIPVSMSGRSTCPEACSFKGTDSAGKLKGCYAEGWPMRVHWSAVEQRGMLWQDFCTAVSKFETDQLWRHNQAGDLPCDPTVPSDKLDAALVGQLATANEGRRGFTYTHYPTNDASLERARQARAKRGLPVDHLTTELARHNRAVISEANLRGLTINVSHDSLAELDNGVAGALPSVVVLPMLEKGQREPKMTVSPGGHKVVTCPAQWRQPKTINGKEVHFSCNDCRLCQVADRSYVIGFRAHGIAKRVASNLVSAGQLNRKKVA